MVPIAESLAATGIRKEVIGAKRAGFGAAAAALAGPTGDARIDAAFWIPGRIEVLGKHTDYAGGRSLLCAAEQGFCLVARARSDRQLVVIDAGSGQTTATSLDPRVEPVRGHWSNYPATVARRVSRDFPDAGVGADIAFASDLPPAAGMSSSSALLVAIFLAISHLNRIATFPRFRSAVGSAEDLAGYLAAVENGMSFRTLGGDRGVGTSGGSEDHTAILCCRQGALSQYRFAPVEREGEIEVPESLVFVIAASGVVADKAGSARDAYNRTSRSAMRVLDAWRASTGRTDRTIERAITSAPDAVDRMRDVLDRSTDAEFSALELRNRFEQFRTESQEIVPAASEALRAGDLEGFGRLVDSSQAAAERWLGNQIAETIMLARSARELGAVAASAFGAGFGGSVWALVSVDQAPRFSRAWSAAYRAAHPEAASRAAFLQTSPGPSAQRIVWPLVI